MATGNPKDPSKDQPKGDVQGEGDYRSARSFNEKSREFVKTHDVERLGKEAAPGNESEAKELEAAEEEGKARAKTKPDRSNA